MKGALRRIRYFSTSLTFLQNLGDTGTSISGRSSRILSDIRQQSGGLSIGYILLSIPGS